MDRTIQYLYLLYKKNQRVFTDSRQASGGGIFFALKGDNFDGNDFVEKAIAQGADYAVSDRKDFIGNESVIYVEDTLKALQLLANYHRRQLSIPVLAITGTNGKTTTKELISSVLAAKYNVLFTQGNLNNHIGVPLTLLKITDEHTLAVIEMGANHPGEIDFLCTIAEPDYGLITNVGRAHLEGFGSFEGVKKTKGELYRFVAKSGKALFVNVGNEHLLKMLPEGVEKITYSQADNNAMLVGEVASDGLLLVAKVLFSKGWLYIKTNLTGAYNLENVLAACCVSSYFNVDPLLIQKQIENYVPSNNRSQVMKLNSNVIIVDCYNANPSSMEVSVRNFMQMKSQSKTMILGDMLELGDESEAEHRKIVELVLSSGIDDVYWIGNNFSQVAPDSAKKFDRVDDLLPVLGKMNYQDRMILIKGSRGIQLEKAIPVFNLTT
ncbi:MAG TPA: UDP-N-acetylmuramoyl-tripeptide--D-alanyl-D-alanine ligase [Prolixibacteraceae bacterium]|nr:UDP-N-acetylmuramoyl-tripeptide--D-alanyl-D-alanine ligase [Prolixibacteraceae bacterium]